MVKQVNDMSQLNEDDLGYRAALLEAINEATPDGILIVDAKGKILSFNKRFAEMWQIPEKILASKDDAAALEFAMTQLIEPQDFIERVNYLYGHADESSHEEIVFKDGRIFDRYGAAVQESTGLYYGWAWHFHDISNRKKAEHDLMRAKAETERERLRLSELFTQAPAMICMTKGSKHVYDFANPLYLKVLGKTEEIIGKTVAQVFPELKGQGILDILDNVYETGQAYISSDALLTLDMGNKEKPIDMYFSFVYQPSINAEGEVDGIMTHAIDVSDQVKARKKIQHSEEHFRALLEHSADAIALTNAEGIVTYVSTSAQRVLGYKPSEMVGQPGAIFIHPDDLKMTQKKLGDIMQAQGKALTVEHRAIHKNGSIRWLETTATNLLDEPSVCAVVNNFRDISERKLAVDELRSTRNQLAAALAAGTIATWSLDISRNLVFGDENMGKFFGVSSTVIKQGLPMSVFLGAIHVDDQRRVSKYVTKVVKPGQKYETECRLVDKKDKTRWVIARGKVESELKGKPIRFTGVLMDITERKQAEQALQNQLQLTETITNNASACLFMIDHNGIVTFMNPAAEKVTLYKNQEAIGKPMHLLVHHSRPDGMAYPESECPLVNTYRHGKPNPLHEDIFFRKDGTSFPALISGKPIPGPGGMRGTVVEFRDITEEKRAGKALADSESRLRFMAESMPQKIFTATPDGAIDYFNPQWMEFTGLSFEQIRGWGWKQFIHPDDLDETIKLWQLSIVTGEPFEFEHRYRRHDGEYRWHYSRAHAMRDLKGDIIMWIGSNTDVEDIKRTLKRKDELEKITVSLTQQRQQLVELNKAKDEFISIASHQLRTPATGVKQYIGMLLEGYAGPLVPEQEAFLRSAYESNERQINVVNDLLKVATVDAGKVVLYPEKTDLVKLLNNVLKEQASRFEQHSQKVTFKPKSKNTLVTIDSSKMRMVFENIIDNASKYSPDHKSIDIAITTSGHFINVAVKDEGVGISKADQEKIFRKFTSIENSLSAVAGGTGIGLYWAKKITELHGGTIEVISNKKNGSTFTVKIPKKHLTLQEKDFHKPV